MSATYDPATPVGRVRLLIADTDVEREGGPLYSDEDIAAFIDMESGSVTLAAALALDTAATDEALLERRIAILGLQTDGPAVAASLRAHAAALRERAASRSAAKVASVPLADPLHPFMADEAVQREASS